MSVGAWLGKITYRIGLNATPVLNTTPPPKNANTTSVKNLNWKNTTPPQLEPHPSLDLLHAPLKTKLVWDFSKFLFKNGYLSLFNRI